MTPDERKKLIEDHVPLARKCVSKYCKGTRLKDDATSVAFLTLCEAARRYDPAGGAQFSTYAWKCIHYALMSFFRSASNYTRHGSGRIDGVAQWRKIDTCSDEVLALTPTELETLDPFFEKQLEAAFEMLTPRQQAMMLGEDVGCVKQNGSIARATLRRELAEFFRDYAVR